MFARRFFAGRYFAPRYFPEQLTVGGGGSGSRIFGGGQDFSNNEGFFRNQN